MVTVLTAKSKDDFVLIRDYLESTGHMMSSKLSTLTVKVESPKSDIIGALFEEISFLHNVEVRNENTN